MSKLYIAVLDDFPDYMVPTLVAHTILNHHNAHSYSDAYRAWFDSSFRKVVVRVNQKEFNRISNLYGCVVGHENSTLGGRPSCAVYLYDGLLEIPNVLKFAKLWAPKQTPALLKATGEVTGTC